MDYDIDGFKNIFNRIKKDSHGIIYSEAYICSLEENNIDVCFFEEKIFFKMPFEIRKVSKFRDRFELYFDFDDVGKVCILIKLFNNASIIFLEALFQDEK